MSNQTHKKHSELVEAIRIRESTYIHGPTASGKSRGVKEACRELGIPCYKKLVGNQTSEVSILGYMDAGGRYVEGIAYKPFTQGGVLVIDEIDNGNPNTNLVLNGLSDRELAFPVGMLEAHPDFCLVATANTTGNGATLDYCGRNRIDGALLNRFVFIHWPYDEQLEANIGLEEYRRLGGTDDNKFIKVYREIQKVRQAVLELKISHLISPRNTLQIARKLATNRPLEEITNGILFKGLDRDTKLKIRNHAKDLELVDDSEKQQFLNWWRLLKKEEQDNFIQPMVDIKLSELREKAMEEFKREQQEKYIQKANQVTATEIKQRQRIEEMEQELIELQRQREIEKAAAILESKKPIDEAPF